MRYLLYLLLSISNELLDLILQPCRTGFRRHCAFQGDIADDLGDEQSTFDVADHGPLCSVISGTEEPPLHGADQNVPGPARGRG